MEDLESIEIRELRSIPLDIIDISESNVRKSQIKVGLEALKASIVKLGLIHPIIVIDDSDNPGRFKLIVGQRRYYAFEELGRETIPSLIINSINSITEEITSFGENIHRRELPYRDTLSLCVRLFDEAIGDEDYTGDEILVINQISELLGINTSTVSRYLSYRIIPEEVNELISDYKISRTLAFRITSIWWPDTQKIIALVKNMTKMTRTERTRALEIGEKNPELSIEVIIKESRKPRTIYELKIPLSLETRNHLHNIAEERKMSIIDLVKDLIEDFLEGE